MANIQLTNGVKIDGKSIQAIDLLWTNANPNSSFSGQTISLNLSDYEFVVIQLKWNSSSAKAVMSSILHTNTDEGTTIAAVYNARVYREVSITNAGIQFVDCYYAANYSAAVSVNNAYCVPYKIYGIKLS